MPAYLLVGLSPLAVLGAIRRDREWAQTFAREATSLWVGLGTQGIVESVIFHVSSSETTESLLVHMSGPLAYWVSTLVMQAFAIHRQEGVAYRSLARGLSREALPHIFVLSAAAVTLGYLLDRFGAAAMAVAAVVLVEGYYPWKLVGEQSGLLLTSLQMMAQAVDLKDPYTSNHSQRVARLAVRLARELDLSEAEVERVRIGALLHDLGKIGVSNEIIRKPGKLTLEEYRAVMKHSEVGADIIEPLEILGDSAAMVRHHHEHWDGSGYPDGLAGRAIPLGARIILVADAFDALTTDRPYRKGTSPEKALEVIRANAGVQFDPDVVRALERIVTRHGSSSVTL
ncbi:MAG: HD-GYP domain-containing protein [Armatimonadota bacterium]|nr:HD-GYP domain-containing protein [Armatimonadota bacterium]